MFAKGNKKEKRKGTVQSMPASEKEEVDVLRDEPGTHFYAMIEELEIEEDKDAVQRLHIAFFCLLQSWFDGLQDDLSDIPPVDQIAQVARTCIVEFVVNRDGLNSLTNLLESDQQQAIADLEKAHLSKGWWLRIGLADTGGYPVTVFWPEDGSNDPATIGNTFNETKAALLWVKRIRPPSRLIKLQRYSHRGADL